MEYRFTRNPLLQSILYHSFVKACKELGYEDIQPSSITAELCTYLRQEIEAFPDSDGEAKELLLAAIRSGKVIATEMTGDSRSSILVRCTVEKLLVDLRIQYDRGVWQVVGVVSIHSRPFLQNVKRLKWVTAAATVVMFGLGILIGTWLPHHENIQEYAKDHGYVLLTLDQEQKMMKDLESTGMSDKQNEQKQGSYTFIMQQGMGTHDLTTFLVKNHLIKDGTEFNQKLIDEQIDRTIQLGTYTFASNMSETQVLDTVKHGPHA